jgi:hypothetical protein
MTGGSPTLRTDALLMGITLVTGRELGVDAVGETSMVAKKAA